jgi:hypothetical protein
LCPNGPGQKAKDREFDEGVGDVMDGRRVEGVKGMSEWGMSEWENLEKTFTHYLN